MESMVLRETNVKGTSTPPEKVNLEGIPETLLWPLWNRAMEQKTKAPLIDDPISADLMERIDYDFRGSFGKPNPGHAIRARVMDDAVKEWLQEHPEGTVISLGEGLDSQFWRVDNGRLNWISVDLPESVVLREQLLPTDSRMRLVACSALDSEWMAAAPQGEPVFIIMAGLLMYFKEAEVKDLLYRIGERFPGSRVFFDLIPRWFGQKTVKGMNVTKTYKAPVMPWSLNYGDYRTLLTFHPSYRIRNRMTYAEPFPDRMRPYAVLSRFAWIKNKMAPWMVHMEIRAEEGNRDVRDKS